MAVIPAEFMNAIVAIGIAGQNGGMHWIGSGFIVGRKETGRSDMLTYYIITNKHVVHNHMQIYIRFNSLGESFVKDYPVQLLDNFGHKMFSEHPNPSTDIIALQIAPRTLINDKSIWGAFELDTHALTLDQMQHTGMSEGNLVYALGFPMNKVDIIKTPICRLGCISRVMDAFVKKNQFPKFLVDAQTFPGNSGGPIVSRPELISVNGTPNNTCAYLIGILSAYIPYQDTLYSAQTGKMRMLQEENSGLTIVHPVDRIREVVDLEWERMERQARENIAGAPVPHGGLSGRDVQYHLS